MTGEFDDLEKIVEQMTFKVGIRNKQTAAASRNFRAFCTRKLKRQGDCLRGGPTPSMPKFKCLDES